MSKPLKILITSLILFVPLAIALIVWLFSPPPVDEKSFVLIKTSNENYGTGFFIKGELGQCTVLTSQEVIKEQSTITTNKDNKPIEDKKTIKFSDFGLSSKSALIIFSVDNDPKSNKPCPYPSLTLSIAQLPVPTTNMLDKFEIDIFGYSENNQKKPALLTVSYDQDHQNWYILPESSESDQIRQRIGGAIVYKKKIIGVNHASSESNKFQFFPMEDENKDEDFLLKEQTSDYWVQKANNLTGKDAKDAKQKYNLAIKINQNNEKAWEGKAEILGESVCNNQTTKITQPCKDLLEARQNIARIYDEKLKKGVKPNTEILTAYFNLCSLYNKLKSWDDTVAACGKYIEYDKDLRKLYATAFDESFQKIKGEIKKLRDELGDFLIGLSSDNTCYQKISGNTDDNILQDLRKQKDCLIEIYKHYKDTYKYNGNDIEKAKTDVKDYYEGMLKSLSLDSGGEIIHNGYLSSSNNESNPVFYYLYVPETDTFNISFTNNISGKLMIENEQSKSSGCESSSSINCNINSTGLWKIKVWNTSSESGEFQLKIKRNGSL